MKDSYNDKIARTDNFWDMDGLLPEKKPRRTFSKDTNTVEIPVPGSAPVREGGEAIPPRPESDKLRLAREALRKVESKQGLRAALAFGDTVSANETAAPADLSPDGGEERYTPEGNPLLEAVTVKPWPTHYSFYESFRRNALRYADKVGEPCEAVSFFSYTPQFVQLSPDQLRYYLYWRSEVKAGRYPKADYAYILLFLYEIINLPDRIPPQEGVRLLCAAWSAYRETYPKLDRHLAEWVCDYCLIHRLTPPADLYEGFLPTVLNTASLKEFYVGYDASSPSPYASALFSYCCSYNWRKSKFITPENRRLFDNHIRGAFLFAWDKVEKEHKTVFAPVGKGAMVHAVTTRDAFSGALCCYDQKRRIEVEYLACSRSVELRYTVTDTVKYAENKIRGLLGIRSRFHTPNLPMPLRQAVDEYFAPYKKTVKKTAAPAPAYDALYEPIKHDLSLDYAKAIEEKAWATTELLVETENEEEAAEELSTTMEAPVSVPTPAPDETASPVPDYVTEALTRLLQGDALGFSALARNRNLLPDALADAVNDALYDVLGDVALEEGDNGWRVVPDYLEDITQWMKK
ncbi:MAG: TerB N-terminal domain-containing protein [Clostridia bacterium]|nr:TerB N-terminal domain-containing protein [Clostridia bacterium]